MAYVLRCDSFCVYWLTRINNFRYAFDAPKRTPQQDLELVARNNLTIQRFLDNLPAWLRSSDGIRVKANGVVYLQYATLQFLC